VRWRGENVGIVFQFFQLLPTLTVLENILLAMDCVGKISKNKRLSLARNAWRKLAALSFIWLGIVLVVSFLLSLVPAYQDNRVSVREVLGYE